MTDSDWSKTGPAERALDFDGINDIVDLGNGALGDILDLKAPFVLSCWAKRTQNNGTLMGRRDGTTTQYQFGTTSNHPRIFLRDNSVSSGTSSGNSNPVLNMVNKWTHYAVRHHTENTRLPFYVNGEFFEVGGANINITSQAVPNSIGARWESHPATGFQMGGAMFDVRIYRGHKTDAEMYQMFAQREDLIYEVGKKLYFFPGASSPAISGAAILSGGGDVSVSGAKGGSSAFETGGGGRLNLLPLKNTDQVAVLQSGGVIQTSASRSVSLGAFIGGGGGIMVASVAGEVHFSAVFLEGAGGLITGARKSANDNAHVGIGGSATAAASKRRPEWSLISGGGAIGTSFSASRMAAIVASAGGYTVVAPTPARLGSVLVVGGGGAAAVAVQVLFNDLMATITITGEIGISVAVSGKIDANTPLTGSQDPVQEFDAILKA